MFSPNQVPQQIRELTPVALALWKRNPVTQAFLLYLEAVREVLVQQHLARWEERQEQRELESEGAARSAQIKELLSLELIHITRTFYPDEYLQADGTPINIEEQKHE